MQIALQDRYGSDDIWGMTISAPTTLERWVGVGHSRSTDASAAGAEAASRALEGREAALLVVFCSPVYDIAALVEAAHREAGGTVALIGCSTSGEFSGDGVAENSVVVVALGGGGLSVAVTSAPSTDRQRAAGAEAAACLRAIGPDHPHRVVVMLSDGLVGSQEEVVRGAYGVVGASVPIVGGCAADDQLFEQTWQFVGGPGGVRVLSGAVVAAAIGSDAPIGVGSAHGWRKDDDEPMVVTRSRGLSVFSLDDRPALDVFLERCGADPSIGNDPLAIRRFALHHPLGLSRREGESLRVVHGADVEERSLLVLEDIPQGALVWKMRSDEESLVGSVAAAQTEAVLGLGGQSPRGMLVFDCAARRNALGPEGIQKEVYAMTAVARGIAFGGFYTYGEFARFRGSSGMNVLTVVFVVFA
jgi:hypothetical protein